MKVKKKRFFRNTILNPFQILMLDQPQTQCVEVRCKQKSEKTKKLLNMQLNSSDDVILNRLNIEVDFHSFCKKGLFLQVHDFVV